MSAEYIGGHTARFRLAANGKTWPANSADIAQARLFEVLLQDEIAELEQLVDSVADRCRHLDGANRQLSEELARLRNRLAEARRLLTALLNRFP